MRGVGSHLGLAVRPVLLDEGVGLRPAQPEREPEAERVAAVGPLPRGGAHALEGLGPHAGHAQQLLLAHNEDFPAHMFDGMALVSGGFKADPGTNGTSHSFTSFTYPGTLPGWTVNWTDAGLVTTINLLFPEVARGASKPDRPRGVQFITREMLKAKSVEEALAIATPSDLALGVNLQIATTAEPAHLISLELRKF